MLSVLFYVFACFALLSGVMVIRAKNPVYSVLFLILVFCNVSGLLLLLNLDFFAMVFLVVYVGAIAVLFLFVIMMLKFEKIPEYKNAQYSHDNDFKFLDNVGLDNIKLIGSFACKGQFYSFLENLKDSDKRIKDLYENFELSNACQKCLLKWVK
jgi:hypothetical protein